MIMVNHRSRIDLTGVTVAAMKVYQRLESLLCKVVPSKGPLVVTIVPFYKCLVFSVLLRLRLVVFTVILRPTRLALSHMAQFSWRRRELRDRLFFTTFNTFIYHV